MRAWCASRRGRRRIGVLRDLEKRYPTFRLSTKRNLDIADRPTGVYGKLRPTGPGEYLMIDTTRLDVFALDPVTLWVQAELTVGMDWRDLVTPNWFGVSRCWSWSSGTMP